MTIAKALYPRHGFINNVLVLLSGSVVAYLLQTLCIPLLAKMYGPQSYGDYASFLSMVMVLITVAALRYDSTIMLPKSNSDAFALMQLSILLSITSSIVTAIIVFGLWYLKLTSGWYVLIYPLIIICSSVLEVLRQWENRCKNYSNLATFRVVQVIIMSGLQLLFWFLSQDALSLILGYLVSQCFVCLCYLSRFINNARPCLLPLRPNNLLYKNFIAYLPLIKYGLPALLVSALAQGSLILLATALLPPPVVGYIALIDRTLAIPSALLGTNIGNVFYQEITQAPPNLATGKIKNMMFLLAAISLVTYFGLFIFLKLTWKSIFGVKWIDALHFLPYFAVVGFFSFIYAPLTTLYNYLERQNVNLWWQLSWLVSNVLIFMFYRQASLEVEQLLCIYTIKQSVLYVFGIGIFIFLSQKRDLVIGH